MAVYFRARACANSRCMFSAAGLCLECGIQILFRGQAGIKRLSRMIRSNEAVAAEFSGPASAIALYNRRGRKKLCPCGPGKRFKNCCGSATIQ